MVWFILSVSIVGGVANAQQITDLELNGLPAFCRIAFQGTSYSGTVSPDRLLSPDNSASMRKSLASLGIPGAHHFCYGLVQLRRADSGRGSYSAAISEFNYSYSRLSLESHQLSYVSSYLGQALYKSGKRKEAENVWNRAIVAQPDRRESYLAFVDALVSEKKYKVALDLLMNYYDKRDVDHADVEHYLAFLFYNLKDLDKARFHVDNAHRLGYPFPGLKEKISEAK